MLFQSKVFVFLFLPVVLGGWFLLAARLQRPRLARAWLLAASLVFYGWWSVPYLGLLLAWMVANFGIGRAIARARNRGAGVTATGWMRTGIVLNLAALGWYKYAAFVVDNVAALTGVAFTVGAVVLPLAISFHTFQQIAYLVDMNRPGAPRYRLGDYLLFVAFFPQLIAGPIVHHGELLPQFARPETYRFDPDGFARGVAFFVMGLVKKLVIADPVSGLAAQTFATATLAPPSAAEAWVAVAAFSVGLYFDFSAYSDMAVGLARMFGIRLPYNFASPYQARSISEFWRRWHMTLSRFLRDYLYIPLGGNRHGPARRSLNLLVTMLLGGLWHGASWTFVVWGGLHGLYLLVDHAWRQAAATRPRLRLSPWAGQALTLAAVALAWTFFAAPDFASAATVLAGMAGLHGVLPETVTQAADAVGAADGWQVLQKAVPYAALGVGGLAVLFAPNSQQLIDRMPVAATTGIGLAWLRRAAAALAFRPGVAAGVMTGVAFIVAVSLMARVREFVYFQF